MAPIQAQSDMTQGRLFPLTEVFYKAMKEGGHFTIHFDVMWTVASYFSLCRLLMINLA